MKTVKEMAKDAKVYIKEHKLEVGLVAGAVVSLVVFGKSKTGIDVLELEELVEIPTPDMTVDIIDGNSRKWFITKLSETPMEVVIDEINAGEYSKYIE